MSLFKPKVKTEGGLNPSSKSPAPTKIVAHPGGKISGRTAPKTIDVYVKHTSGRTTTFDLVPSDPVRVIYDRVAGVEGVGVDCVRIKYTGKTLNPDLTVGYMGICAETILKAEVIEKRSVKVKVQRREKGGAKGEVGEAKGEVGGTKGEEFGEEEVRREMTIDVYNTSLVRDIITEISSAEDIPVSTILLKFPGRDLEIDRNGAVMESGITEGMILEFEVKAMTTLKPAGATNDVAVVEMTSSDKEAVIGSFETGGRPVEVVFSFDTTGSMYACLDKVRSKLGETVRTLIQRVPNIRIGLIAHGDYCDYNNYVLRSRDLTTDVDSLVRFAADVPATGGGDGPECYEWVLRKAQLCDWSEHSAKALVMIGDCEPHEISYTDQYINWHTELDLLVGMGVKVYGVQAMNSSASEPFYRELADRSGGAYISFNNFDIIAEMFLAVCYREASNGQYEQYCEDFRQATPTAEQATPTDTSSNVTAITMTTINNKTKSDMANVIDQLDKQCQDRKTQSKRYVTAAWWDPSLCDGMRPGYTYDAQTDSWKSILSGFISVPRSLPFSTSSPLVKPPRDNGSKSSRLFRSGRNKTRKTTTTRTSTTSGGDVTTGPRCCIM